MKNKKVTISVLLFLCAVIWGIIAWKVYSALEDSSPSVILTTKQVIVTNQDSIRLLLNYRDPFLDEYAAQERANPEVQEEESVPEALSYNPPFEEESQPNFQYKGIIRIGKSTQAIIFRQNESVLLKAKDKIGEFTILKITEEHLTVRRKGKEYQLNKE